MLLNGSGYAFPTGNAYPVEGGKCRQIGLKERGNESGREAETDKNPGFRERKPGQREWPQRREAASNCRNTGRLPA